MQKLILTIVLESLPVLLELLKETYKQIQQNETNNTKPQENELTEENPKMDDTPNPLHNLHP